jgi:hypothetical protein
MALSLSRSIGISVSQQATRHFSYSVFMYLSLPRVDADGTSLAGEVTWLQGGVGIDDAHFYIFLRPHNVRAFDLCEVVDISLES